MGQTPKFSLQVIAYQDRGRSCRRRNQGADSKQCKNQPDFIRLSDCCVGYPDVFSYEIVRKNCTGKCEAGKSGRCCRHDCMWNVLGFLTEGKFDAAKAKVSIFNLTGGNSAWTSDVKMIMYLTFSKNFKLFF